MIDFLLWVIAAVFILGAIVAVIYLLAAVSDVALALFELITTIFEPIIDRLTTSKSS